MVTDSQDWVLNLGGVALSKPLVLSLLADGTIKLLSYYSAGLFPLPLPPHATLDFCEGPWHL